MLVYAAPIRHDLKVNEKLRISVTKGNLVAGRNFVIKS